MRPKNKQVWVMKCPKCGKYIYKSSDFEKEKCECGWIWKGAKRERRK